MKIQKFPVASDLSSSALEQAVGMMLPVAEGWLLKSHENCIVQVHPDNIQWALKVQTQVEFRFSIQLTPHCKPDAWAFWIYGRCVWSEGA